MKPSRTDLQALCAEPCCAENGQGRARVEGTGEKKLLAFAARCRIEAMFEGALFPILARVGIPAITFGSLRGVPMSLVPDGLPILITFGL
ncbi:MAG: hypothetical protein AAGI09_10190 [Pseudomonadota bacterium]